MAKRRSVSCILSRWILKKHMILSVSVRYMLEITRFTGQWVQWMEACPFHSLMFVLVNMGLLVWKGIAPR